MEYFDILREDGSKTGEKKLRNQVHKDGDLHGSVHLWMIRDGQVLFQKRREDKESYPGAYDVACAGHITSGEETIEAAFREIKEELNLTLEKDDLIYLYTKHIYVDENFHGKHFVDNELIHVFFVKEKVSLKDMDFQKEEIEGLYWKEKAELLLELEAGKKDYCLDLAEYKKVLEFLDNQA